MAADDIHDFNGLYTAPNPLKAPEGALVRADNVVVRTPGLLEPRRGFSKLPSLSGVGNILSMAVFQSQIIVTTDAGYATSYLSPAYAGTYQPPDASNPTRYAQANKSLYFTTASGVQKLDAVAGPVVAAGTPPVFRWDATTLNTVGNVWLANGSSVAYRAVIGRYDANGYLMLSEPTQWFSITNTAGVTASITTFWRLPTGLFVGAGDTPVYFLQVYRSVSVAAGNTPPDELFQVAERPLKAADLAAGRVSILDETTDAFCAFSPPLYTNPNTGDGPEAANTRPPLARDIALFRNHMFYANTTQRHSVDLTLIGVGAPSGLQPPPVLGAFGDYITIGGVNFYAQDIALGGTNSLTFPAFATLTTGTPAQNIEATVRNLCAVVTDYFTIGPGAGAATLVRAYYTSGPTDRPGNFRIEEIGIGGSAFTVSASRGVSWSPDLTAVTTSDNETRPARIYISNEGLPESVGLENFVDVGAADKAIQRIIADRSGLWIFKADGLFYLTGDSLDTFDVRPFDLTVRVAAPQTVLAMENGCWFVSLKGLQFVSESGVLEPISAPIDPDMLLDQRNASFSTLAFGIGYESEGFYILFAPTSGSGSGCGQQRVCNISDGGIWTRWDIPGAVCGLVNETNDKIHIAVGNTIWTENKNLTSRDFFDPASTFTWAGSTASLSSLVFSDALHGIQVGDLIEPPTHTFLARVTAVDGATVTLDAAYGFFNGLTYTVNGAIQCEMRFLPVMSADPLSKRLYTDGQFSFKVLEPPSLTVAYDSDVQTTGAARVKAGVTSYPFGLVPWGSAPFGAPTQNVTIRADMPQNAAECSALGVSLSIPTAGTYWQLQAAKLRNEPAAKLNRR